MQPLLRHVPVDTGGMVGEYVLGRRLGAGGMGVVYEAQLEMGDPVAIKLPYCEVLDDATTATRFRDEAVAGSIVEHPNLAAVYAYGEAGGVPYIVMKRLAGERIATRVAREGMLPLRRAAHFVRQVLDGVAALHAAGVVHGDVKSDNVLVDGDHATLIDFGLAHAQLDARAAVVDAFVSGTPEYMAPEVIRGEGSTPASDIYAAGVVLYELVTGAPPFTGATSSEILHRQLSEPVMPPSLRCVQRDVPAILERIVLRALDKEPASRFSSAAAFASALQVALPCLDDAPAASRARVVSTESPTLEWRRDSTRRRLARGTRRRRR